MSAPWGIRGWVTGSDGHPGYEIDFCGVHCFDDWGWWWYLQVFAFGDLVDLFHGFSVGVPAVEDFSYGCFYPGGGHGVEPLKEGVLFLLP